MGIGHRDNAHPRDLENALHILIGCLQRRVGPILGDISDRWHVDWETSRHLDHRALLISDSAFAVRAMRRHCYQTTCGHHLAYRATTMVVHALSILGF